MEKERPFRAIPPRRRYYPGMKHIDTDLLIAYHAEILSDAEEEEIEIHVADCDECAREASTIYSELREDNPEMHRDA